MHLPAQIFGEEEPRIAEQQGRLADQILRELGKNPPNRSRLAKAIAWLAEVFLQILPKFLEAVSKGWSWGPGGPIV